MLRERRNRHTGGCIVRLLLFFVLTAALGYIVIHVYAVSRPIVLSPLADDYVPQPMLFPFFPHQKDPDDLRNAIKQTIGSDWDNYSVYVVDYTSDFEMGINESSIYEAASVNKVPIMAAIYDAAQKGKVDFDKVITMQQSDIQDYGTGTMRYDPPGSTYSVKTLVQLMMQKSDNTAAYILANYILTLKDVQDYVNNLGLTQTDILSNKTSNQDMAILFDKIYHKQLVNPALSAEMLGLLKDSDFEDRIPGLLPKETKVYHKIGTQVGAVHDVGVVQYGKKTYYVGIFTKDVGDEEQAAELEAKVSKTIFDFMTG